MAVFTTRAGGKLHVKDSNIVAVVQNETGFNQVLLLGGHVIDVAEKVSLPDPAPAVVAKKKRKK